MTDEQPTVSGVVSQLEARTRDAVQSLEALAALRERIVSDASRFENSRAVLEYLDYFAEAIEEVVRELTRIAAELPERVDRAQIDLLRQVAANCRVEQRRCLVFRDQCINRPLPDETMRPLLNDLSVTTRDQLTAFYDLASAAGRLDRILASRQPQVDARRTIDRRRLFTRLFTPPKGGSG